MGHGIAPTVFLPPLVDLDDYTPCQVLESLRTLKRLYFSDSFSSQPSSAGALSPQTLIIREQGKISPRHVDMLFHEDVPDSGYASAEEDSKSIERRDDSDGEEGDGVLLELLRADDLERGFAIKWLTGFLKRADSWMTARSIWPPIENEDLEGGLEKGEGIEGNIFAELNDEASALLARIASYGGDHDDSHNEIALTRQFRFPINRHPGTAYTPILDEHGPRNDHNYDTDTTAEQQCIVVELNDAPLDAVDHTAVGLQSWASAIVLAKRMCANPGHYLLPNNLDISTVHFSREPPRPSKMRVLELGAGTGLLSIVAAKLYRELGYSADVKATDYHPMVLENLIQNVRSNFSSDARIEEVNVDVEILDWSSPPEIKEGEKYDIVLAADVIYDPRHAHWICDCVTKTLKKPMSRIGGRGGVFWLAMPLRSTGRHEGMERTVEDAFPALDGHEGVRKGEHRLVVVSREGLGRQQGIGRADECGYTLFEIRWT
ncbi:putative methyltransferase-domain-containing protein [Pisolithus albus]|nr:putative methyltransferase-domain-containing protein [Pisolithus albus]